jgi:excisionase family DNA binding protein
VEDVEMEPETTPRVRPEPYLRASEAAALLRVSAKTVSRWANQGRIPHVLTLGGHRRFPREAVEALARRLERNLHMD